MKLVVTLCSGSRLEELRELLERHEVHGYSEINEILGSGETGRHMGTRVWPGASAMIFAAVDAAKADELIAALTELTSRCSPEEGLRVMVLPVERMV